MQIIVISDFQKAIEKAKDILYEKVDKKTVLFLSGGATPKSLYASLAKDKIIKPAAVGLIDERQGEKLHENSNEKMIQETGLLDYLRAQKIPFYPILPTPVIARSETTKQSNKRLPRSARNDIERKDASKSYDQTTRDLFFHFPKSVAIMGVGTDGHIAGIPPVILASKARPGSDSGQSRMTMYEKNQFVTSYYNKTMNPPERITMTFAGLSLIDFFIVLIFGKEKKNALKKMFQDGSLEEIPARFFTQQASNNSIIITDQQV